MDEIEKGQQPAQAGQDRDDENVLRVNDRRRFDPAGNPRSPGADGPSKAGAMNKSVEQASQDAAQGTPNGSGTERAQGEADNEALRKELESSRKRVDELARAFQALSNDREEFKQRLSRERERLVDVEKGNVAQTLLEVMDELDLSLQAVANDQSPFAQGVRLIRDGILTKLQGLGIERIDPLGQHFDPNLVEAADIEVTDDPSRDQKVVSVTRAGYRMKDRVIRPARAKVARYLKPAQA